MKILMTVKTPHRKKTGKFVLMLFQPNPLIQETAQTCPTL